MKKLLVLAAFLPVSAFAHGSLVHQASMAVDSAGVLLAQSQPREVLNMVTAISAVKTGHEMFTVTIALSNQAKFQYACHENEDVEPVIWECAAK